MPKTTYAGLELTTDLSTDFGTWQKSINGEGDGTTDNPKSNMQLIDDTMQSMYNDMVSVYGEVTAKINAIYGTSGEVTLTSSAWASNNTYTLSLTQLGANDAVFFSPVSATDKTALETANVIISASTGTVVFTALAIPSEDISLNYFIARGEA